MFFYCSLIRKLINIYYHQFLILIFHFIMYINTFLFLFAALLLTSSSQVHEIAPMDRGNNILLSKISGNGEKVIISYGSSRDPEIFTNTGSGFAFQQILANVTSISDCAITSSGRMAVVGGEY